MRESERTYVLAYGAEGIILYEIHTVEGIMAAINFLVQMSASGPSSKRGIRISKELLEQIKRLKYG